MSTAPLGELEYEAGLSHHRLAAKYLRAAKILYTATIHVEMFDINAMFSEYEPLIFLCCHSMELNFKAYLIAYGMPVKTTETRFGHNIGKLARECCSQGMTLPEWTKQPIDIANAIFTSSTIGQRADYRARYPKQPSTQPTAILFPNYTVRTTEQIAELGGAAAEHRFAIIRGRKGL